MAHARASACRASGLTGVPFGANPRSSFLPSPFLNAVTAIALASVATGAMACGKKEPPPTANLGEPIGVRVDDVKDASGKKLGSLTGAFAITKGQAAEPLVPAMARILDRVGKSCPAVFAKGTDPMHAIGKSAKGVLDFGGATAGESPEQRCFREAMHGQKLSDTPLDTDIAVELRPEVAAP